MPRIRFDRPIAHRGLHDRANGVIENSRTAFEHAIAKGFAIECDLQLTRDGIPVVFHDPLLKRLLGRDGRVSDLTAAEITRMPLLGSAAGDCPQRFSDLLEQVAGRTLLQVELKRQQGPATGMLAKQAAAMGKAYAGALCFESFDPALVILVRRFGYKGPRGIITERYENLAEPEIAALTPTQRGFLRGLWHWPWSRFDFISCDKSALDLPAVRFWRTLGKPVTAWTIRSAVEAATARPHIQQIVFEGFDPDRG